MKQCPACLTTYTDETLRYCLADGSILKSLDGESSTLVRTTPTSRADETVVMGTERRARFDVPIADAKAIGSVGQVPQTASSSSMVLKIVAIVVGLGIFALLLVGVAGGVYYYASNNEPASNTSNVKQPTASPTPAKDDRDDLRDQIANLEKRLDEQKKSGQNANVPQKQPNRSTTSVTARVDSPSDGFLALRSLPNSEMGERVLKIPHGATVSIGACGPVVAPVKRKGRWCQASYGGYDGWVFDAYLIY